MVGGLGDYYVDISTEPLETFMRNSQMAQDPQIIDNAKRFLTNPYFVAFASPGAFLALGSLGKGVTKEFSRHNFYLGFNAGLTALYAAMIYLYDLARDPRFFDHGKMSTELNVTTGYLLLSFITFFLITGLHRAWDRPDKDYRGTAQFMVLGVFCNVLGLGLLAAFVLIVKGVT